MELEIELRSQPPYGIRKKTPLERQFAHPRLLNLQQTFPMIDEPVDVSVYNDLLVRKIKDCLLSARQRKPRIWWKLECSAAKVFQRQAWILSTIQAFMTSVLAHSRARYRRTLRRAKRSFKERAEGQLLKEAELHRWLRHSRPPRQS